MERYRERLTIARQALDTLDEVLAIAEPSQIVRDAAIQRFEYTLEAVWKAAGCPALSRVAICHCR